MLWKWTTDTFAKKEWEYFSKLNSALGFKSYGVQVCHYCCAFPTIRADPD